MYPQNILSFFVIVVTFAKFGGKILAIKTDQQQHRPGFLPTYLTSLDDREFLM